MKYFKDIKEKFESKISNKEEFKNSSGLLKDFGSYLEKIKVFYRFNRCCIN